MLRLVFNLLIAIFLIWFAGLVYFYTQIPTRQEENIPTADAIIVLTGGKERIAEGVRLMAGGKADKLLISGVNKDSRLYEVLQQQGFDDIDHIGVNLNNVYLGHKAVDTVGNAQEAEEWVKEYGAKEIILVTSNYHMPRAYFEFWHEIPGLRIYKHPVIPANFDKTKWMSDKASRNLIILEYGKLVGSFLSHL